MGVAVDTAKICSVATSRIITRMARGNTIGIAPAFFPDPVGTRIGERDAIGFADQHHRIGEVRLDAVIHAGHDRHIGRMRADQDAASFSGGLRNAHDVETGQRVRARKSAAPA